jgi:S1-C subfamily serine protease
VPGDVITSVAGRSIASAQDLRAYITTTSPGQKVAIAWTDTSGRRHRATVTLAEGPAA